MIRPKKRYGISEHRRCPKCYTKSYTKFVGSFTIYSYYCTKCGHVHSTFYISGPMALVDLAGNPHNLVRLSIADVIEMLESSSFDKPMSLRKFDDLFKSLSKQREKRLDSFGDEAQQLESDYGRVTASILDIFKVLATHYNKVYYNTPVIRLLRILANGKWLSMAEIRKEYGSKYVDDKLNLTWLWYLTDKSKQGRELLYKITSKGKAFLKFVDKAINVLPEGTSIFDDKVFQTDLLQLLSEGHELSRPLSLREYIKIVLDEISLTESREGIELNSLLKALKSKYDIGNDMALRLIEQLKKDNSIYEPKKGYLKRKKEE